MLILLDEPLARVPQLAIHLDRDVNERGLLLDKQVHLAPVWGLGPPVEGDVRGARRRGRRARPGDIAAWDLMLHDLTPPSLLGVEQELIASARLDNLCSSWAAVTALVEQPGRARADRRGLPVRPRGGGLREHHRARPGRCSRRCWTAWSSPGGGRGDDRYRALRRVVLPLGRHGPRRPPELPRAPRAGPPPAPERRARAQGQRQPALRHRRRAPRRCSAGRAGAADVPSQVFVSRNSMPCGSTIGPLTAGRLGIATADVGCAQLSMHSARELCGADDPGYLVAALGAYFAGA